MVRLHPPYTCRDRPSSSRTINSACGLRNSAGMEAATLRARDGLPRRLRPGSG